MYRSLTKGKPARVDAERNLSKVSSETFLRDKVMTAYNKRMVEEETFVAEKGHILDVCIRNYCQLDFEGRTINGRIASTEFVLSDITNSDLNVESATTGTLYDPAMGLSEETRECRTCRSDTCGGHKGLIKLPVPIFNSMSISLTMDIIACVCLECKHIVFTVDDIKARTRGLTSPLDIPKALASVVGSTTTCSRGHGKVGIVSKVKKVDSTKSGSITIMKKPQGTISKALEMRMMNAGDVTDIFNTFEVDEIRALGFKDRQHLLSLILTHVVVIPPIIRPYKLIDGGVVHHELTNLLKEIISERNKYNDVLIARSMTLAPSAEALKTIADEEMARNNRLKAELIAEYEAFQRDKNLIEAAATKYKIEAIDRSMREKRAGSYKQGIEKTAQEVSKKKSSSKKADSGNDLAIISGKIYGHIRAYHAQICSMFRGKKGVLREIMLAKRGTQGARAVVSPAVDIEMDEVEIPAYIAETLGRTEEVTEDNLFFMRKLYWQGKINHVNMRTSAFKTHGFVDTKMMKKKGSVNVGDVVIRQLLDGDLVIVGRMPTLHKYNMLAFRARIVHGQKTVGVYFAWTSVYGMDFDGDEVSLWIPDSKETVAEVMRTMYSCNNFISVRTSQLNVGISFNALVSWYIATSKETTSTKKTLIRGRYLVSIKDHNESLREVAEGDYTNFMTNLLGGNYRYTSELVDVPINDAKSLETSLKACDIDDSIRTYLIDMIESTSIRAIRFSYDSCNDTIKQLLNDVKELVNTTLPEPREDEAARFRSVYKNYKKELFNADSFLEDSNFSTNKYYDIYASNYLNILERARQLIEGYVATTDISREIKKYRVNDEMCEEVRNYLSRVAGGDLTQPIPNYSKYGAPLDAVEAIDEVVALLATRLPQPTDELDTEQMYILYEDATHDRISIRSNIYDQKIDLNKMLSISHYTYINANSLPQSTILDTDNAKFLRYMIRMVKVVEKAGAIVDNFPLNLELSNIVQMAFRYTDSVKIMPYELYRKLGSVINSDEASHKEQRYAESIYDDSITEDEYEAAIKEMDGDLYLSLSDKREEYDINKDTLTILKTLRRSSGVVRPHSLVELIKVRCYLYSLSDADKEEINSKGSYNNPAMTKSEFFKFTSYFTSTYSEERVARGEKGDTFRRLCREHGISPYSTRALFSAMLPEDFTYPAGGGVVTGVEGDVAIRQGILIKGGPLTSEHIGTGSRSLIYALYYRYGQEVTKKFIEDCYLVGNALIESGRSFSISYDDCYGDMSANKVDEMRGKLEVMETTIGLLPKNMDPEEREKKIQQSLAKLDAGVSDFIKVQRTKREPNPILLTTDSLAGSKGSNIHIRQMSLSAAQQFQGSQRLRSSLGKGGTRVNQADYCGETNLTNKGFVSSSFAGGLTARESDSADAGSRDAAADSAIRTPESGELARQLAISEIDLMGTPLHAIRSSNGRLYQMLYGGDGFDASKLINLGDSHLPFNVHSIADKINAENGWYRDVNNKWTQSS